MKRPILVGIVMMFAFAVINTEAVPLTNPAPSEVSDDIDGSGYFSPFGPVTTIEQSDLGSIYYGAGNTFGFYYEGSDTTDSSNLFTIFDVDDDHATNSAVAVIDFINGFVYDYDETLISPAPVIQTDFSGSLSTANIGFFLGLTFDGAESFGGTIFSDASLNDGNDWFGAFPYLGDPNTMALFFDNSDFTFGIEIVNGVQQVAVPEPSSFSLLIICFALMFSKKIKPVFPI